MTTPIVGLAGWARAGKDEAAKALIEDGWERRGFADIMRSMALAMDPLVSILGTRLSQVVNEYGWDGYKGSEYGHEVRLFLQRLGTDAGRNLLGENVWVDAALRDSDGPIVVTDVRFPNEAQAVRNRGGLVLRVTRPGVKPAAGPDGLVHVSETALDDWDFVTVRNDGTVGELHATTRRIVHRHFNQGLRVSV